MCRFLAYSGEPLVLHDLLYGPEHSLIAQSCAARRDEDPVNADGVGVGWFAPEISPFPAVFRSPQPAWSCASLRSVSTLVRTGLAFAHVRSASPGSEVSEANCHPFASGPFLWMHNGSVGGFPHLRDWARRYLSGSSFAQIRGTTDSEHLFALFLEQWAEAGSPRDPEGLLDAFRKTLAFLEDILRDSRVTEPSSLNLALTDGATTMVSRHGLGLAGPPLALHVARGVRYLPGRPPRFEPAAGGGGVLVASEPLFADPAWEEVPPDRIVLVRQGSGATLVELGS